MKKICMVVPSFSAKGGIAAVVSGYRGSELEKRFKIKYIETYCDGSYIKKTIKAITSYMIFIKELLIRKPDIVHIHSSFGASFYRKALFIKLAAMKGMPVINHIHGADFDDFYKNRSAKTKNKIRLLYDKCDILIALSDEWKKNLSELVPENKINIIENYSVIHVQDRKMIRNTETILFMGFLCERKGCFDIPKIVEKVCKKIPNAKFVLAGSGEDHNVKKINEMCHRYGVEKNIIMPGWVRGDRKDDLLRTAEIFFLPSYNEGMPMSILDAMGYGLPIVSTKIGGIPQIVHDRENGFVFEPGDIEGFSNAIIELLTNNDERYKMGQESLKIVKEEYSLEQHIEKIIHLYNEVLYG